MHGENVRIYDDILLFKDNGVVFKLKEDILPLITDYDFSKTDSLDAKQIISFMHEMNFDIHTTGKNSRDRKLLKNYYNKRNLLASGLQEVIFLSKNSNKICDRL